MHSTITAAAVLITVLLLNASQIVLADNKDFKFANLFASEGGVIHGVTIDTARDESVYLYGYTLTPFGQLTKEDMIGEADCFLVKLASDGSWIWGRVFGSKANDYAVFFNYNHGVTNNPVIIPETGDILLHGVTYGSFDGQSALNNENAFVVRYTQDGQRLTGFTFFYGQANRIRPCCTIWDSGYLYVGGCMISGFINGVREIGGWDAYVVKYLVRTLGPNSFEIIPLFTRIIGGTTTSLEIPFGMVLDKTDGRIYIGGWSTAVTEDNNGFVAQLQSNNLALVNVDHLANRGDERVYGMTYDERNKAIYLVGYSAAMWVYNNIVSTQMGQLRDQMVIKYFPQNFSIAWVTMVGTNGWDHSYSALVDPKDDGVYVVGAMTGTFSAPGNWLPQARYGDWDATLSKISSNGSFLWTKSFGTQNTDDFRGITQFANGSLLMITGYNMTGGYFPDQRPIMNLGFGVVQFDGNYTTVIPKTVISETTVPTLLQTSFVVRTVPTVLATQSMVQTAYQSTRYTSITVTQCTATTSLPSIVDTCPIKEKCDAGTRVANMGVANIPEFQAFAGFILSLLFAIIGVVLYYCRRNQKLKNAEHKNMKTTRQINQLTQVSMFSSLMNRIGFGSPAPYNTSQFFLTGPPSPTPLMIESPSQRMSYSSNHSLGRLQQMPPPHSPTSPSQLVGSSHFSYGHDNGFSSPPHSPTFSSPLAGSQQFLPPSAGHQSVPALNQQMASSPPPRPASMRPNPQTPYGSAPNVNRQSQQFDDDLYGY
jgi:hypothetical protein